MFDDYVQIEDLQIRSLEAFYPVFLRPLANFPEHATEMLLFVSAPLARLLGWKKRKGWWFPTIA